MRRALLLSGNRERQTPAILVAGTNGKGTTCACLVALLEEHGFRTALYTSPHVIDLEERFRIGGVPVERDEVARVGEQVFDRFAGEDAEVRLTFFELTTLMAVNIFANHPEVDVCIYEVGLGGRLDATNAIEPSLSVVATIGLDHQQYLGDSIEEITAEKMAISRPDVPLIVGEQEYPAAAAALMRHPLAHTPSKPDTFGIADWGILQASYQRRHFATAASAAETWMGRPLDSAAVVRAAARVRWPGRLQHLVVEREGGAVIEFLFDAAHNKDGIGQLTRALEERAFTPDVVLCGAMKDKALAELFSPLADMSAQVWGVQIANPRAAGPELLSQHLPPDALLGPVEGAMAYLDASAAKTNKPLKVLVFGSIYLLGEVFSAIGLKARDLVTYRI